MASEAEAMAAVWLWQQTKWMKPVLRVGLDPSPSLKVQPDWLDFDVFCYKKGSSQAAKPLLFSGGVEGT